MLDRLGRVHGDAAVTAGADCHGQGNQLTGLGVQVVGPGSGATGGHVTVNRVGRELLEIADAAHQLITVGIPVHHAHCLHLGVVGN
ncbi:hypothetical protein D9M71_756520 [compost metagenome]